MDAASAAPAAAGRLAYVLRLRLQTASTDALSTIKGASALRKSGTTDTFAIGSRGCSRCPLPDRMQKLRKPQGLACWRPSAVGNPQAGSSPCAARLVRSLRRQVLSAACPSSQSHRRPCSPGHGTLRAAA